MKKLTVALLLVTMSLALVGCGKEESQEPEVNTSEEVSVEDSVEVSEEESETTEGEASEDAVVSDNASVAILTDVWNAFAEEEKFPAMGGDYTTMVDGAPGAFDITKTEDLTATMPE